MTKRILIIAAHPDDECIGAGATIKRLVNDNNYVAVFHLGDGLDSRGLVAPEVRAKHLTAKTSAAKVLGAKLIDNLSPLPDQRFETVGLLEITKRIEAVISEWEPDVIYTHSAKDLNLDHQITHRAVLTACRTQVPEIYAFEVLSSSEWNYGRTFQPNVFVDITETLAAKIEAMKCYDGELRQAPHPRSLNGIHALATNRGMTAGFMAAEAFELVRKMVG